MSIYLCTFFCTSLIISNNKVSWSETPHFGRFNRFIAKQPWKSTLSICISFPTCTIQPTEFSLLLPLHDWMYLNCHLFSNFCIGLTNPSKVFGTITPFPPPWNFLLFWVLSVTYLLVAFLPIYAPTFQFIFPTLLVLPIKVAILSLIFFQCNWSTWAISPTNILNYHLKRDNFKISTSSFEMPLLSSRSMCTTTIWALPSNSIFQKLKLSPSKMRSFA